MTTPSPARVISFGTSARTVLPEMMRRIWPMLVARGALMAVFGILALAWPQLSAVVLISIFGIYALIDGLTSLGYGFAGRRSGSRRPGWFLQGAVAVAAGAIALLWPAATGAFVLVLLGLWSLFLGGILAMAGLAVRRSGARIWAVPFVLGLLGVGFGIVLLVEPAASLVGLTTVLGILMMLFGTLLVLGGLRLRRVPSTVIDAPVER